jgi:hypothetical protein
VLASIEAVLCVVAVLVALIAAPIWRVVVEKWEGTLGHIAENRRLAVIAVGVPG